LFKVRLGSINQALLYIETGKGNFFPVNFHSNHHIFKFPVFSRALKKPIFFQLALKKSTFNSLQRISRDFWGMI